MSDHVMAVLCCAGNATRLRDRMARAGVRAKGLLPVREETAILDFTLAELYRIGVRRFVVVANERNHDELQAWCWQKREQYQGTSFSIQRQGSVPGSAGAVYAGLSVAFESMIDGAWVVWSDMVFKLPPATKARQEECCLFLTSVDELHSWRFDAALTSGGYVVGISPRTIEKRGPFLMNTGVSYLTAEAVNGFLNHYEEALLVRDRSRELSFEHVLDQLLRMGVPVKARSLDYMLEMGTEEAFEANHTFLWEAEHGRPDTRAAVFSAHGKSQQQGRPVGAVDCTDAQGPERTGCKDL